MANLGYLQLTRNCYQKCQFCSNPPTGVHLDEAEMRRNIDSLVEMGYDGVILTGGEPSISELLFPALSYAREKKLFSRMITNGQKLAEAMDYLLSTGRSFRAERVPLCYMRRFAWASTEARKIIKEEERCIRFLDFKGFIHQKEFLHGKGNACDACRFDPICAGMYSMAKTYDERELSPIFEDPTAVIAEVLGHEPSPELLSRLLARRGRRSMTEQPSIERRERAMERPL